jgi:hypothetical protein
MWLYLLSAMGVAVGLFALALAISGGMGMGDVKMGGMLGAFLGPTQHSRFSFGRFSEPS